MDTTPLPLERLFHGQDAFEESILPIRVDESDWHRLPPAPARTREKPRRGRSGVFFHPLIRPAGRRLQCPVALRRRPRADAFHSGVETP